MFQQSSPRIEGCQAHLTYTIDVANAGFGTVYIESVNIHSHARHVNIVDVPTRLPAGDRFPLTDSMIVDVCDKFSLLGVDRIHGHGPPNRVLGEVTRGLTEVLVTGTTHRGAPCEVRDEYTIENVPTSSNPEDVGPDKERDSLTSSPEAEPISFFPTGSPNVKPILAATSVPTQSPTTHDPSKGPTVAPAPNSTVALLPNSMEPATKEPTASPSLDPSASLSSNASSTVPQSDGAPKQPTSTRAQNPSSEEESSGEDDALLTAAASASLEKRGAEQSTSEASSKKIIIAAISGVSMMALGVSFYLWRNRRQNGDIKRRVDEELARELGGEVTLNKRLGNMVLNHDTTGQEYSVDEELARELGGEITLNKRLGSIVLNHDTTGRECYV